MLLFKPTFWLLYLLSSSLNGQILFYQAERSPGHLPSLSISLGFPRYQSFFHEVLVPKSSALFCIIGWLMGHIYSRFLCSWACSLELSQSQPGPVAYPEDPRFLGISRHPSSAFSLDSPAIFSLKNGLSFSFSLLLKAQSLPIHGFRHLPTYF